MYGNQSDGEIRGEEPGFVELCIKPKQTKLTSVPIDKQKHNLPINEVAHHGDESSGSVEVSIVLPAYNEEGYLHEAVEITLKTLEELFPPSEYEIIIVEDGCDDRTSEIAAKLALADKRIHHIHNDEQQGLGAALEKGFQAAEGSTLVYFDVDMATDIRHLEELIKSIQLKGYDFAIGSRRMRDRKPVRKIISFLYNSIVQIIFRSKIKDHQCGFKAFDREALFQVLDSVESNHWVWTTEVLVYAQKYDFSIRELPVNWTPKDDSKVKIIKHGIITVAQWIRLWWQLSKEAGISSTE